MKSKCFKAGLLFVFFMVISAIALAKSYPAPIATLPNENGKMASSSVWLYESQFEGYRQFINGRYAFTIDFPQEFTKVFLPANGDGGRFSLPDESAGVVVSGGHNTAKRTLEEYYLSILNRVKGQIGYTEKRDSWFVVTWKENGKIYYRKQFVSEEYQNSCTIWYPEEQKDNYDEVVSNIESSFTPGWLTGYKIWG
ncbi:hypothetical protein [Anaeroarcus burkinensis]|uniref:hypothetical protein n=1 Tax=Anaeroarcus burkinensis TaxID=82376 RepID=UPI00040501DF|nr:hypothetical protein [Anaeroarcus burkinensis]